MRALRGGQRVLGILLVLGLFAMGIARLRRVPRPRFEPVARYANGGIVLGRVVLARPGERGMFLGWSVVCGGREVIARTGSRAPVVLRATPEELWLQLEGDKGRAVSVSVRTGSCRTEIAP